MAATLLPVELIQKISENATFMSRKHLRLTCSKFSAAIRPIVLGSVAIDFEYQPKQSVALILALVRPPASDDSGHIATLVRRLRIGALSLWPSPRVWDKAFKAVENDLPTAISNLHQLEHLQWTISKHDMVLCSRVLKAFNGLTKLKSVTMAFDTHLQELPTLFPLHMIRNLHGLSLFLKTDQYPMPATPLKEVYQHLGKMIAMSPELHTLRLGATYYYGDLSVSALTDTLPSLFRQLRSLELVSKWRLGTVVPGQYPCLTSLTVRHNECVPWRGMIAAGIKLRFLDVQMKCAGHSTSELLAYFQSYDSMEELHILLRTTGQYDSFADQRAATFYKDVLPLHSGHLRVLRVLSASAEDSFKSVFLGWSFSALSDVPMSIASCKGLKELCVFIVTTPQTSMVALFEMVAVLPDLEYLQICGYSAASFLTSLFPPANSYNQQLVVEIGKNYNSQVYSLVPDENGLTAAFVLRQPEPSEDYYTISSSTDKRSVSRMGAWLRKLRLLRK